MNIKHGLIIIISLLIAACAEPQKFLGPNKNTAYFLDCSNMGLSLGECYKKAGELCPEGYSIINSTTNTTGFPSTYGGTYIYSTQKLEVIS